MRVFNSQCAKEVQIRAAEAEAYANAYARTYGTEKPYRTEVFNYIKQMHKDFEYFITQSGIPNLKWGSTECKAHLAYVKSLLAVEHARHEKELDSIFPFITNNLQVLVKRYIDVNGICHLNCRFCEKSITDMDSLEFHLFNRCEVFAILIDKGSNYFERYFSEMLLEITAEHQQ